MQEKTRLSRQEIIDYYLEDTLKLLEYYRWLNEMSGTNASSFYKGEGIEENSMAVPVYDSNLLRFVKTVKNTKFHNKNYVYTFSSFGLKTVEDELTLIERCTLQDVKVLGDILSKYIIKGEIRGAYWSEGLKSGVYLAVVLKLRELLEIKTHL